MNLVSDDGSGITKTGGFASFSMTDWRVLLHPIMPLCKL